MEKFAKIKEVIDAVEAESTAFMEKETSAGTRLRNAMQRFEIFGRRCP